MDLQVKADNNIENLRIVISRVSGFKLGSVIHFQLRFGQIETKEYHFILLNIAMKFNQHSLSKMLPFFRVHYWDLYQKQMNVGAWAYTLFLNSVLLIYNSVVLPVPYCFHYYKSVT